jgi:hypothetical protein
MSTLGLPIPLSMPLTLPASQLVTGRLVVERHLAWCRSVCAPFRSTCCTSLPPQSHFKIVVVQVPHGNKGGAAAGYRRSATIAKHRSRRVHHRQWG